MAVAALAIPAAIVSGSPVGTVQRRTQSNSSRLRTSHVISYVESQGHQLPWEPMMYHNVTGEPAAHKLALTDDQYTFYEGLARASGNLSAEAWIDYSADDDDDNDDLVERAFKDVVCYGSGSWARTFVLTYPISTFCYGVSWLVNPPSTQIVRIQNGADGLQIVNEAGDPMSVVAVFRALAQSYNTNVLTAATCAGILTGLVNNDCTGSNT